MHARTQRCDGAARFGDGWLGIWVSPRRFATVTQEIPPGDAGRDPNGFEHALNVWCGFGASRDAAREPLADAMQGFYQMSFEPFERYSPYGSPEDVAALLHDYVDGGCIVFNVIACAADHAAVWCRQPAPGAPELAGNAVAEREQLDAALELATRPANT